MSSSSLHYRPTAGEVFPPIDPVIVPILDILVKIQSANGMTLKGVSFAYAFSGDCGNSLGPACDRDEALMAANAVQVNGGKGVTLTDLRSVIQRSDLSYVL
jgi:hypothetical protein